MWHHARTPPAVSPVGPEAAARRPQPFSKESSVRVRAYVDGFNLYYGSLKGTPFKWLDLLALAQAMAPGHSIEGIRYFTARVSGKVDPDVPRRQNAYLSALSSLRIVTVHYGKFLAANHRMPLAHPRPAGPRFAEVVRTEEKGSDVNLATYLILDGCDGLYELALVISNDSDLKDAVAQASTRFAPVWVVNPNVRFSNALKNAAARYIPIPAATLAAAQFPDVVTLPNGAQIHRPGTW
jgi:uncharacterized LabA/DUF88 family protein